MGRDSPTDLRGAVNSLARVKALETRAGASRIIWHKGNGSGELLSWVDGSGRLLKQLLVLFDDVVLWQHGQRLRTGKLKPRSDAAAQLTIEDVEFDGMPDKERHGRAKLATATYEGADKYIQHVARIVEPIIGLTSAAVVTRASNDVLQRQYNAMAKRESKKKLMMVGGALLGAALLALLLRNL